MHHLLLVLLVLTQTAQPDEMLTVAEASQYTATASSAEVADLLERIRSQSRVMGISELGKTSKGLSIPLAMLSNPPLASPPPSPPSRSATSAMRNKPVCFILANIHAGEVEGKEASLMLIRELALTPDHPLLRDLTILFVPNYNADGNDEFDAVEKNRPGQSGPVRCGIRANAQGLDLNRDYVKLQAPESRALIKLFNEWDPDITIDCHTTNGSLHRYVLTYESPLNPSGHPAPMHFVREELLPEVTKRIKDRTGYDMWFYGNFSRNHTAWETYSSQPRFGGAYQGLRNQMSVLSEAYSYAPFQDRVIATREFIREILHYVAQHKQKVLQINALARRETAAKGLNPRPDDVVGIRHQIAAFNEPAIIKGYANATGGEGGAAVVNHQNHGPPKDFSVIHLGRFEPTLSVRRPFAYLIPPGLDLVIDKLRQHGIDVCAFTGEAVVEAYTITRINRAEQAFQNHRTVQVDVECELIRQRFADGSFIVRTGQPLGTLAVYLLEPQSDDGLTTWSFLEEELEVGKPFPIVRVRSDNDIVR
jgi:dipeptidyl-peptidase-4